MYGTGYYLYSSCISQCIGYKLLARSSVAAMMLINVPLFLQTKTSRMMIITMIINKRKPMITPTIRYISSEMDVFDGLLSGGAVDT